MHVHIHMHVQLQSQVVLCRISRQMLQYSTEENSHRFGELVGLHQQKEGIAEQRRSLASRIAEHQEEKTLHEYHARVLEEEEGELAIQEKNVEDQMSLLLGSLAAVRPPPPPPPPPPDAPPPHIHRHGVGEDYDPSMDVGEEGVDRMAENAASEEKRYANQWMDLQGNSKGWKGNGREEWTNAQGIPKQYTPCLYFFKAPGGCKKDTSCEFSHSDIFCQEPYASKMKSLSWERKSLQERKPPPWGQRGSPHHDDLELDRKRLRLRR